MGAPQAGCASQGLALQVQICICSICSIYRTYREQCAGDVIYKDDRMEAAEAASNHGCLPFTYFCFYFFLLFFVSEITKGDSVKGEARGFSFKIVRRSLQLH